MQWHVALQQTRNPNLRRALLDAEMPTSSLRITILPCFAFFPWFSGLINLGTHPKTCDRSFRGGSHRSLVDEGLAAKFIPVGWAQLKPFRVLTLQGPSMERDVVQYVMTNSSRDFVSISGRSVSCKWWLVQGFGLRLRRHLYHLIYDIYVGRYIYFYYVDLFGRLKVNKLHKISSR